MFAKRLKKAREGNGLTQAELAEKICKPRVSVARWEIGMHQPSVDEINALCDVLGVSADWLIGRTNKRSAPRAGTRKGADEKTL